MSTFWVKFWKKCQFFAHFFQPDICVYLPVFRAFTIQIVLKTGWFLKKMSIFCTNNFQLIGRYISQFSADLQCISIGKLKKMSIFCTTLFQLDPRYSPIKWTKSEQNRGKTGFSPKKCEFLCTSSVSCIVPFLGDIFEKNAQIRLFWAISPKKREKNVNFLQLLFRVQSWAGTCNVPYLGTFTVHLYYKCWKNVSFCARAHLVYTPIFSSISVENVLWTRKKCQFFAQTFLFHFTWVSSHMAQ